MRFKYFYALFFLILVVSCKTNSIITNIDVSKAKEIIRDSSNLIILDVRTQEEVAEGMIEKAINIDYEKDDFITKVNALDKSKPILVYCKGGGRSADAVQIMEGIGFSKIYNLEDGYEGWK